MKKIFVLFFFILLDGTRYALAQDKTVNIYYDSTWRTTTAEQAVYRRKFVDRENYFACFTFSAKSNKLLSRFNCLDMTEFPKMVGTYKGYFEDGQLQDSIIYSTSGTVIKEYKYFETGLLADSILFNGEGKILKGDHYYVNNKPYVHFLWDPEANESSTEAFDTAGEKINNFVYARSASFFGGGAEWRRLLDENMNYGIASEHKAPKGRYKTAITFTIDENGDVTNVRSETKHGYGIEEEAIRGIKASPRWEPAIFLNKTVKAYRRQPFTFIVD